MQYLGLLADFLLHVDQHLAALLSQYGGWIYAILFLIVFCETGLVVMPFLPGDSLLFIAGALAAAVLGDTVNYAIGRHLGKRIERWPNSRFFKRSALDYTHGFYERHGGKTIIIARFMPLVRTFAPFVAGMAPMAYRRFAAFNVLGAALWVGPLVMLGYWFGNFPFIKNNLTAVILGIVALSLTPLMLAWLRHRRASARKAVSHP